MTLSFQFPLLINDIEAYLPHRAPMLMLDQVVTCSQTSIHAQKRINADAWFLQGHFPDQPLVPGVIIVEAIAQAGALLCGLNGSFDTNASLLAFTGIDSAKFRKSVYPDETICVFAEIVKQRRNLYKFTGRAEKNGEVVTQLSFSAASMPRQAE